MKLLHKIEKSENCVQCERKFDNQREMKGKFLCVHEEKKSITDVLFANLALLTLVN